MQILPMFASSKISSNRLFIIATRKSSVVLFISIIFQAGGAGGE
jgi:hypothetical protein